MVLNWIIPIVDADLAEDLGCNSSRRPAIEGVGI